MKKRLLIVDDQVEILNIFETAWRDEYQVFSFLSAEEALVQMARIKPHVIVSDITLPGMSGYEFCSHLKDHEDWKALPLVLISSKIGSNARRTGYRLGAINYLEKPFDPLELGSVIDSILRWNEIRAGEEASIEKNDLKIDMLKNSCFYRGKTIKLTKSEMLLLRELIRNFDMVCHRSSLVEIIESKARNDRILDTYVKSLRIKLGSTDFKISTVYGKGYKIESPTG